MKFAVRKLKPAEADALKAAIWYDELQPGLGSAFLDDLDATIAALVENPLIYSIRFADVRCIRLRRFTSYGVFYMVMGSEVWLLAVHHDARHSRWLRERRRKIQ